MVGLRLKRLKRPSPIRLVSKKMKRVHMDTMKRSNAIHHGQKSASSLIKRKMQLTWLRSFNRRQAQSRCIKGKTTF